MMRISGSGIGKKFGDSGQGEFWGGFITEFFARNMSFFSEPEASLKHFFLLVGVVRKYIDFFLPQFLKYYCSCSWKSLISNVDQSFILSAGD